MRKNLALQPSPRHGIASALAVGLLFTSGAAFAGATIEQKCQDGATNAAIKFFASDMKAVAACEAGRADGSIPAATNCRPTDGAVGDATTATAINDAKLSLADAINKKCTSANFALMTFGQACGTVATAADLVNCIADDAHGKNVDNLLATIYDDNGMNSSAAARACQADTAAALSKYVQARLKERRKCAKSIASGKAKGPCPNDKTNAKFDKALAKAKDGISGSCSQVALGAFDAGFPCDLYTDSTFTRQGMSNGNSTSLTNRFSRCAIAAAAGDADLSDSSINPNPDPAPFSYGVAAGDMTDTAFIAWTRTSDGMNPVTLEVATDPDFTAVVNTQAMLTPNALGDNTVKTEVTGLSASTEYYYRFSQSGSTSRVGHVKTAPISTSTAAFNFAFTGDANAYFKPYSVLEQITEFNPDVWLFIGDTIYGDDPRSGSGVAQVRSDYHNKYKENRDDRAMRDALSNNSFYTIWDDHEVTNDFWGTDPAIQTQMQQGNLAFRDYMPVRVDGGDPMKLYRSFKWGDVAEFFLIDARSYRSSQADITETQCVPGVCSITQTTDCHADSDCMGLETCFKGTCSTSGDPCGVDMDCGMGETCNQNQGDATPNATCQAEIDNPARTYLGATQLAWLENGLQNSTAKFKFVMNGPVLSAIQFVPYDRWEGYSAERDSFLNFVSSNSIKNVVFLSTDIHAAILNTNVDGSGITEYVSGAIGMDPIARELPADLVSLLGALPTLFSSITYYDLDRFNVATLQVSQTSLTINWRDGSGQLLNATTLAAQ